MGIVILSRILYGFKKWVEMVFLSRAVNGIKRYSYFYPCYYYYYYYS